MADGRRSGKPLAAIVSQAIVAGSSLLLQLVALHELGTTGLGQFAVLFGILITVNSIQSGWLGDSLTVLDRFDPGIRRALVRSQLAIVAIVFTVTTVCALPIGGVSITTAVLFGAASTAWVVEETMRRLLIARREFIKLVVNDAAFAFGSFGLIGFVWGTGGSFTLETLVIALLGGAVVAIAVGVIQLPSVELSRGILGPSRMRDVASFAVWRAAQVGLRPGSQAIVRVLIVALASYEALGQLESARLILAPVLTIVNGAGVYLLPTYAAQAKAGRRFNPAVPFAMMIVAGLAAIYGAATIILREPLTDLLTREANITVLALLAWTAYSVGFGAGVPVGNALVARGRSRIAFNVRVIDASMGVVAATVLAALGWVDAVPFGLAAGTFVGAALLLRRLRELPAPDSLLPPPSPTTVSVNAPPAPVAQPEVLDDNPLPPLLFGDISTMHPDDGDDSEMVWQPAAAGLPPPARTKTLARVPKQAPHAFDPHAYRSGHRTVAIDKWLWLIPLLAIVATEYKFRRRAIGDALGGSIDLMIMAELGIYGLIGLWAVWRLAPTKPRLTPLTVTMWGYILTTAASALYSSFPLLGMARAVQLVILGAVVHTIAVDGRLQHITKLIHGWIVLLSFSILAGLAYVAPTTLAQQGRFTWLFVHSVSAGSMLALSVPMLLGLWLSAARRDNPVALPWPRWAYGALLVFHGVFLLATRTRGSIGGCFIAVAIMAWVWSGQKAKPQLVLGSLVVGAASLLAFGGPVFAFITRGESAEKIGTFNRRTEIWTLAWESFLTRPLHGLGFTSAKGAFFDETGLGGAHNALINVMIDAGLVGLAWWTGLLIGVGVAIFRLGRSVQRRELVSGAAGSARADSLILLGMFTSSVINSVTTEGLGAGVNVSAIWLYLMVAWICVLRREARPEPEPVPTLTTTRLAATIDA
jgi:exopolysaccharide production protein ExoQ